MDIKGFIRVDALGDNQNGVVAPLGEISAYALSAAIEKSYFSQVEDYPGVELVSFRNRGLRSNPVAPPPTHPEALAVLEVGYWCARQAQQGFVTDDPVLFLQNLNAALGTKIMYARVGDMKTNGDIWLPEYLRYQVAVKQPDNSYLPGDLVQIWFADDSFRRQYSTYDIAIVPPVKNLDDLHNNKADVTELVNSRTSIEQLNLVKAAAGKEPYTVLQCQTYDWIDKTDREYKLPTDWTVVIWGPAGDNPDIIREELVDYILDNSQYPRSEWEKILPDLFISTEFTFIPNWDQYAIENKTLQQGLYSPMLGVKYAAELAARGMPTYPVEHTDLYLRASTHPYKSLSFVVCGGPRNRDGIFDFYQKFKDYVSISTTHLDFDRISPRTTEWMLLFAGAIIAAEEMTETTEIPEGYARIKRNNLVYCSFSFEKVQYLIATKAGMANLPSYNVEEAPPVGTWLRIAGGWVQTLSAQEFMEQVEG